MLNLPYPKAGCRIRIDRPETIHRDLKNTGEKLCPN